MNPSYDFTNQVALVTGAGSGIPHPAAEQVAGPAVLVLALQNELYFWPGPCVSSSAPPAVAG